jgi:hypothetical protein
MSRLPVCLGLSLFLISLIPLHPPQHRTWGPWHNDAWGGHRETPGFKDIITPLLSEIRSHTPPTSTSPFTRLPGPLSILSVCQPHTHSTWQRVDTYTAPQWLRSSATFAPGGGRSSFCHSPQPKICCDCLSAPPADKSSRGREEDGGASTQEARPNQRELRVTEPKSNQSKCYLSHTHG